MFFSLSALNFIVCLGRISISNARSKGLEIDLGLQGDEYNMALAASNIPYMLLGVPSNFMPYKVAPSIWLSARRSAGVCPVVCSLLEATADQ